MNSFMVTFHFWLIWFMMFNATFYNISFISVLLVAAGVSKFFIIGGTS
jgi:hypothetical protein